jgi:hypothetical protein
VTVERLEIGPTPAQIENGVNVAQQMMIIWNEFLEIELVESRSYRPTADTIIAISRPDDFRSRNHAATIGSTEFFNSLSPTADTPMVCTLPRRSGDIMNTLIETSLIYSPLPPAPKWQTLLTAGVVRPVEHLILDAANPE